MNKLAQESSPYLLQHQNNPVNWFPWGKEALDLAQAENKLIVLSIGYSACHWCHVMEHESFENHETADIMNRYFVCIKVDREERPDIDQIYMEALQAMGKQGGWPLNMILLPNQQPIFGGTYFPKKNWENLLLNINDAFYNTPEKLMEASELYTSRINLKESDKYNFERFETFNFNQIIQNISKDFDLEEGGFQQVPKFPMPSIWIFIANYLFFHENHFLLEHLKFTLDRMVLGGIFDHLGGGWTRYSTDKFWKVPHFEKMAYDNGQLLSLYSQTILLFKKYEVFEASQNLYRNAINKTVTWISENLLSGNGGFFTALDADSEGVEGKYYVWSKYEIVEILKEDSNWFCELYNITENGNWEEGTNILHLEKNNFDAERLAKCNEKLNKHRSLRIMPQTDTKQIAALNAILLNGLLDAKPFVENDLCQEMIAKNATFFENEIFYNKTVWHQTNKNEGFLDDYSFTISALIKHYQNYFEEDKILKAKELTDYCIAQFYDEHEGLFYFTSNNAEQLIARKKEIFDNVIPSSNANMAQNLFVLAYFFEDTRYSDISNSMLTKMSALINQDAKWLSAWANLALLSNEEHIEVAISGENAIEIAKKIKATFKHPNLIISAAQYNSKLPTLLNRFSDKTQIFICKNKSCLLPVSDFEAAMQLLWA